MMMMMTVCRQEYHLDVAQQDPNSFVKYDQEVGGLILLQHLKVLFYYLYLYIATKC